MAVFARLIKHSRDNRYFFYIKAFPVGSGEAGNKRKRHPGKLNTSQIEL